MVYFFKKYILLFLFLNLGTIAIAQIDNSELFYTKKENNAVGQFSFHIFNSNFQRNYEYFNKFADGFTLFGSQFFNTVNYQIDEYTSVSGGVYFRNDYGGKAFADFQPTYTLKYEKDNTQLIVGSIKGGLQHKLVEPIFNFDRSILNPIENGIQFLADKRLFYLDAWLNWETMIYKVSPIQEKMNAGINSELKILNGNKIQVSLPIQITAFHKGGQIDSPDRPLVTIGNSALGMKFIYKPALPFLSSVQLDAYFLGFKDFSNSKLLPYSQGNGWFANLQFRIKDLDVHFNYWKGKGYLSPFGNPIYLSESQNLNHPYYREDTRELVFVRFIYRKKLSKNLYLDNRFEPVVDLKNPIFDFSNSIFIVYQQNFELKKKNR